MTDNISNELQEIAEEVESRGSPPEGTKNSKCNDENDEERLSKDEIASEFDVQFAKKQGNTAQHLVAPDEDDALCGIGLGKDVKRIDTPGPFDPICKRCRAVIEGGSTTSGRTYADLRQWLAEEIDGVKETEDPNSVSALRKAEVRAIVSYIQTLKEVPC